MDELFHDIEQTVIMLRTILLEAPKIFDYNKECIERCEKEIMDLEHVIELTSFNAARGYALSKEIQNARKRRRELKDQNDLLDPLVEIASKVKSIQSDINKALGEVRRIKQRQANRSYKMRVREDLQEEVGKR